MNANSKPLVSLIQDLIAKEPYELNGFKWAARPDVYYCEALVISVKTLGRRKKDPLIQWKRKRIDGKIVTLLRIGEPDLMDPEPYALALRGVWRNKTGRTPANREQQCLWGFCKDVMALPEVKAFTDKPGEFAVAAFKHALDNWQLTAGCIKLAAETVPGYKPRFWHYPNVPTILHFFRTVVYVHAMALQAQAKTPNPADIPAMLAAMAPLNKLAAIMEATDEAADHPGVADPDAPVKEWPLNEPWKPIPYKKAAE